ncbi:hypothetical protein AOLI_G00043190 [Acnodon oligacanthus]
MTVIFFIMFLWRLLMTEAALTCQQLNDGTLYFIVNNNQICEEYSWKINGKVVAHDRDVNETLVLNRGPNSISFRTCVTNVTFTCNKDTRAACAYDCSAKPLISDEDNLLVKTAAIVLGVVAVIFIIIIIFWWKRNKLNECCQPERDSPI